MERSAWPKNLSSSRKHAMQDLLHAQNPKNKRKDLIDAHSQTGNNTGQPLLAEDPVINVLGSFSNTLSPLSSTRSDEDLQVLTNACVKSEVSEGSESINTPLPRVTSDTWTRLDQTLINNGQQKRIYDQKSILDFELPKETSDVWWTVRLIHDLNDKYRWRIVDQEPIPKFAGKYYKCAHQIDQGCQATKLVERTSHDPRLFLITYRGRHTCNNLPLTDLRLLIAKTGSDQAAVDGGFSSDIKDKIAKNELARLQVELQRMNAKNRKLKEMLGQVTSNYNALQEHLSSLLQLQQQCRDLSTPDAMLG